MIQHPFDQYIRSVSLSRERIEEPQAYPFCLKAVKALDTLSLHPNVTFIVGENGSGKSTLLEAVAAAYGFNPEGGTRNISFATNETHSRLHEYIRIAKGMRAPKDGYFLRAESFYNLASTIDQLDSEPGGPRIIDSYGGKSLHAMSHGESFLALFLNRFSGRGMYILDEPEAALSPTRQLAFLSRLHQLVNEDSQFIIATHSPIMMAYPHACIYEVGENYTEVPYEETEHYRVTREFLSYPDKMLKELFLEEVL